MADLWDTGPEARAEAGPLVTEKSGKGPFEPLGRPVASLCVEFVGGPPPTKWWSL